jgi:hypothetical protein
MSQDTPIVVIFQVKYAHITDTVVVGFANKYSFETITDTKDNDQTDFIIEAAIKAFRVKQGWVVKQIGDYFDYDLYDLKILDIVEDNSKGNIQADILLRAVQKGYGKYLMKMLRKRDNPKHKLIRDEDVKEKGKMKEVAELFAAYAKENKNGKKQYSDKQIANTQVAITHMNAINALANEAAAKVVKTVEKAALPPQVTNQIANTVANVVANEINNDNSKEDEVTKHKPNHLKHSSYLVSFEVTRKSDKKTHTIVVDFTTKPTYEEWYINNPALEFTDIWPIWHDFTKAFRYKEGELVNGFDNEDESEVIKDYVVTTKETNIRRNVPVDILYYENRLKNYKTHFIVKRSIFPKKKIQNDVVVKNIKAINTLANEAAAKVAKTVEKAALPPKVSNEIVNKVANVVTNQIVANQVNNTNNNNNNYHRNNSSYNNNNNKKRSDRSSGSSIEFIGKNVYAKNINNLATQVAVNVANTIQNTVDNTLPPKLATQVTNQIAAPIAIEAAKQVADAITNNDNEVVLSIPQSFKILNTKKGNMEAAAAKLVQLNLIKKIHIPSNPKLGDNSFYVYKGPDGNFSNFEEFLRVGATTLPVIPPEKLAEYRQEFTKALHSFPEYKRSPTTKDKTPDGQPITYVAGGFAALGNPASFHNPFVRNLRIEAYSVVRKFLYNYFARLHAEHVDKFKFEMLFDRMMFRRKGQQGPDEAWHRDVMKKHQIEDQDEIYGGWINLDSTDQYFSFIPGSHLSFSSYTLQDGFSEIKDILEKYKDDQQKRVISDDEVKKIMKEISDLKYRIKVPPGHVIIFPQYILHEVVGTKVDHNMMRLFVGWRVTTSSKSIYVDKSKVDLLDEIVDNQQVPQLPGGMIPPVFGSNHLMFYLNKPFDLGEGVKRTLSEWSSETFVLPALVDKINTKTKAPYTIVNQTMKSLKEYNLPLYQPYPYAEKRLYKPTAFDAEFDVPKVQY